MPWVQDAEDVIRKIYDRYYDYVLAVDDSKFRNHPKFKKLMNLDFYPLDWFIDIFASKLPKIEDEYAEELINFKGVPSDSVEEYLPDYFTFNIKPKKPVEKMTLADIADYLENTLVPFIEKLSDKGWLDAIYDVYYNSFIKDRELMEFYQKLTSNPREVFDDLIKTAREYHQIFEEIVSKAKEKRTNK